MLNEGKITADHRCCWGVHWKDMNQMAQESNTARTISVMRTGPLSRPFIFGPPTNQENTQIVCVSFTSKHNLTTNHRALILLILLGIFPHQVLNNRAVLKQCVDSLIIRNLIKPIFFNHIIIVYRVTLAAA